MSTVTTTTGCQCLPRIIKLEDDFKNVLCGLKSMEHNMSAKLYNMFLPHDRCNFAKVLTVKGVVPSRFPLNPAAFWSMPDSVVIEVLNDYDIDHSHTSNDVERLEILGMHIGVKPKTQ